MKNCAIILKEIDEMARLEAQESVEYYKWLFWIEHIEFEKELLENIFTIEVNVPDINFDIPTPWTHFRMRFNL